MGYLFSMGGLGWFIFISIILVTVISVLPYCYVLVRLVSKAWHKSKNEERNY